MSNLLPIDAQKDVWSAYRARLILAGALLLLAAALLSAIALTPGYAVYAFVSSAGTPSPSIPLASADPSDTAAIARTQSILSQIESLSKSTTTPTMAISAALAKLPRGVKIDHVTYTGGNPGALMLVGIADSREGINAYRDALDAEPLFQSVSVPVGALVGAQGGRFTMTLSGPF